MSSINGEIGSLKDLNRAIDIEMRKAHIYGAPEKGAGKFRYLIMADESVIADFPGDASKGAARKLAEASILTETDRNNLTQLRWKKLMPTNARLGIVTSLFQIMAWRKVAKDLDTSMAHEKTENGWRYVASVGAMSGTIAETVSKWSESAVKVRNRTAIVVERYLGRVLRIGGKALGIAAGAVMAVWDGLRGIEELGHNNSIGWLYLGSAVAGVGAMIMFSSVGVWLVGAATATGIGIILVVIVIAIAILIEIFKDDKMQDWLERCYFGTFDKSERYGDAETEMKELEIALQG